jgi:transglutaminase-like putative cysteine protease
MNAAFFAAKRPVTLNTPSITADRVTFDQLLWVTACLGLALLAGIATLPVWIAVTVGGVAGIRLVLAARGSDAPPRTVRFIIATVAIGLLFLQFRTFNGLSAGSALLSLIAGLKLLETRTRRDLYVVPMIIYFLCLAAILQSESFWLLAYLVGVCWLTTATLMRVSRISRGGQWRGSARHAGRILAQALPLALALWLFFPRLGSPLWQTSSAGNQATSGLSDTMSPGDISDLGLSDDIAFRVHFNGDAPPRTERYYRGPVLHDFDGHTWSRTAAGALAAPPLEFQGKAYQYTVSLEPNQHNWLFALDWPSQWDTARELLTSDYMLMQTTPVSTPTDIVATSYTHGKAAQPLTNGMRQRDTQLSRNHNPRTLQLAATLRSEHPDDLDYIHAVLDMFHEQPFYYTLNPPLLADDSVDGFLFDTKRGYCGHYASAFAVLMRAAGIPTRVVTGYQGGTFNRFANYWILRQSDAHAWDEVWIDGSGWLRIDPTGSIAAERVEVGLNDLGTQGAADGSRWEQHSTWFNDVRLRLDALRVLWRNRILRFNEGSQEKLLAWMHIPEPDGQKVALVLATCLILAMIWLTWLVRRDLTPRARDPVARAYERLCRRLAAIGLPRSPHEGAESYAARVAAARPDLASVVDLCRRYSQLRYSNSASESAAATFIANVRAFRPAKQHASNGNTASTPPDSRAF